MNKLKGRRALITGAARGIGRAIAQALGCERAAWTAMLEQMKRAWGGIDILVNNAGITRDKSLRKMTDDDWLAVLNTNLNACYFGVSAVMPI